MLTLPDTSLLNWSHRPFLLVMGAHSDMCSDFVSPFQLVNNWRIEEEDSVVILQTSNPVEAGVKGTFHISVNPLMPPVKQDFF